MSRSCIDWDSADRAWSNLSLRLLNAGETFVPPRGERHVCVAVAETFFGTDFQCCSDVGEFVTPTSAWCLPSAGVSRFCFDSRGFAGCNVGLNETALWRGNFGKA